MCIKNLLFIGFYVIFQFVHFDLILTLWRLVCCLHCLQILCHPYFQESAKIILNISFMILKTLCCQTKQFVLFHETFQINLKLPK
jgi:hypothetical protein